MSSTTPLLPDREDDDTDVFDAAAETSTGSRALQQRSRFRRLGIFVCVLVATAAFLLVAVWTQHHHYRSGDDDAKATKKRNLVMMVSDGMGPASLSLARSVRQLRDGLPPDAPLSLDRHFWGTSRTRSSNSLVTDSAAGATAFSCGLKTYNGAVAVLPDGKPCGTVLEAAHRAGFLTGLVVTTDVTDATPACFASHAALRLMGDSIALQEVGQGPLGRVVDLILGGGRCHFLPNSTQGSCRADDTNVLALAAGSPYGWSVGLDRTAFDVMRGGDNVSLPTLGLFALTDVPFEIDRRRAEAADPSAAPPSLSAMASTALRALELATANDPASPGFFLMIEGSRIDHAGHGNDPAAQAPEVLEYDRTFQLVLDFLANSDTEGVLISTSDHETGGLALALQEPGKLPVYNWYPAVLLNASASSEDLARQLREHLSTARDTKRSSLRSWIETHLVIEGLGISDATPEELDALVDAPDTAAVTLAQMVSLRAHIGWSTHGHSAIDVNIYAYASSQTSDGGRDSSGGTRLSAIRGNVENTEIGAFLRSYLDVDVDAVTRELRDKMGPSLDPVAARAQDLLNQGACQDGCELRRDFI